MLHNIFWLCHLYEHRLAALVQQQGTHLLLVLLLILHELNGTGILWQSFLYLLPCVSERCYCLFARFSVASHLPQLQQQSFAEQRYVEQERGIGILKTVTVGNERTQSHPELFAFGIVHACQVVQRIVLLIVESLFITLQGIGLLTSRRFLAQHHYLGFLAQHLGISPSFLCAVLLHSASDVVESLVETSKSGKCHGTCRQCVVEQILIDIFIGSPFLIVRADSIKQNQSIVIVFTFI